MQDAKIVRVASERLSVKRLMVRVEVSILFPRLRESFHQIGTLKALLVTSLNRAPAPHRLRPNSSPLNTKPRSPVLKISFS